MRKKVGSTLPEMLIDQIFDRTSGVPLFVEEFTKMVQESGALATGEQADALRTLLKREIPATLQDLMMARLDRMDGEREVAQLAATLGREFSYDVLAAVAQLDENRIAPMLDRIGDEVRDGLGQAVLVPLSTMVALCCEAVDASLGVSER